MSSPSTPLTLVTPIARQHPYKRGDRVVIEGLPCEVLDVGHCWVIVQLDDFTGEWAYNYTTRQLVKHQRPEWLVS